jgi:hypothetical protein
MTENDSLIRILFEIMPIFLATLALLYCGMQISNETTLSGKLFFMIACINCILLMTAQVSWTWTVYVGDTIGTLFADYTWTVFNSLVMISYLFATNKTPTDGQ